MFNSESRWDRRLPHEKRHEDILQVGVIFKAGKAYPRWFIWKGRKYPVTELTFHWTDKRGGESLHFYSVSDGTNLYQIYFHPKKLHWRLDKTCPLT